MGISDRKDIRPTTFADVQFKNYNSPFAQLNAAATSQEALFLSSPMGSFTLAIAEMNKDFDISVFGTNPILPKLELGKTDIGDIFKPSNPIGGISLGPVLPGKTDISWSEILGGGKNPPPQQDKPGIDWRLPILGGAEPIRIENPDDPYKPEEPENKYGAETDYANLSKSEAEREAEKSDYLERIEGGSDWSVSDGSFVNDIKYAAKGMNKFLSKLAKKIRRKTKTKLVVTSALGTKNSPHAKGSSSASHYNPTNPKIDFGGQLSHEKGEELLACLRSTGFFSRCEIEYHGNTCHIDVQVKQSELDKCA